MYRKRRSIVWEYFERKTPLSAICLLCKREYRSVRNTTNLHDHLNRKHLEVLEFDRQRVHTKVEPVDADEDAEPVTPETLRRQVTPTASTSDDATRSPDTDEGMQVYVKQLDETSDELPQSKIEQLNDLLVAMICKDLHALSIVESGGFTEFVREMEPRYRLPNRKTLRHSLQQIYKNVKDSIMENLREADYVSISTEVWTNLNGQSFLTSTSHYFSGNKSRSSVLATSPLNENQTSEHITLVLKTVLREFDILNKTVAVVTDNAANVKGAVRNLGLLHLPCTAHTLNSIVNESIDAIPDVVNTLEKCRSLVTYLKTDSTAANKLKIIQTQCGMQSLKLEKDVSRKWNSTLVMLRQLVEMKVPVVAALEISKCPTNLIEQEWKVVDDVIKLLKPIEYVTRELIQEKYSTASKIIPFVGGIQDGILITTLETGLGHTLKNNIINNIERRFADVKANKITTTATIMDPRFKTVAFEDQKNAETAVGGLRAEVHRLLTVRHAESLNDEEGREKQSDRDAVFWRSHLRKVSHLNKCYFESSEVTAKTVERYLELPYESIESDPIAFWNRPVCSMAELRQISRKYLTIPATCVPSERIFSEAGEVMIERRNRLSEKDLDTLIFLNYNMQ